jgi:hypothetical protein
MKYKLFPDPSLNLSSEEIRVGRERLGRFGNWDGEWWEPLPHTLKPELKIDREGFIISERR